MRGLQHTRGVVAVGRLSRVKKRECAGEAGPDHSLPWPAQRHDNKLHRQEEAVIIDKVWQSRRSTEYVLPTLGTNTPHRHSVGALKRARYLSILTSILFSFVRMSPCITTCTFQQMYAVP